MFNERRNFRSITRNSVNTKANESLVHQWFTNGAFVNKSKECYSLNNEFFY